MLDRKIKNIYKFCVFRSLPTPNAASPIPLVSFLKEAASKLSYKLVDSIESETFCILPYTWNQYVEAGLTQEVIEIARDCYKNNSYLIIWNAGDLEAIVPIENALQFENGLHRSVRRKPKFAFELPAFWPDYLDIYFKGEKQYRKKRARPLIGFCGQAASQFHKLVYFTAKNLIHNFSHLANKSAYIPPPIVPPILLRNRILNKLSQSSLVDTSFIIRDQYRAGVRKKADRDNPFHPTKVEFVNNIIETDYTVCVRGGGNFSVRLYETLSCGRIPIFIDTDSRLPYDFILDWKDYCIWIDRSEINHIAEKVSDFHTSLSDNDFVELQVKCRNLWEKWLRREAFFSHFYTHLLYVQQNDPLFQSNK